MSGRFVSAGTIGASGEPIKEGSETPQQDPPKKIVNKEWEAVQQELEADRKRREEQRVKAAQGEEKSLFDILQENKAAKQAAFEEANKIRNQFRALDDDEVEFLDEVRQRRRAEEEQVRRETEDRLKAFREQQQKSSEDVDATSSNLGDAAVGGETAEQWGVGRKRKRVKDREVKGVKRRTSVEEDVGMKKAKQPVEGEAATEPPKPSAPATTLTSAPAVKPATGTAQVKAAALVAYGSDSDDE